MDGRTARHVLLDADHTPPGPPTEDQPSMRRVGLLHVTAEEYSDIKLSVIQSLLPWVKNGSSGARVV